MVFAGPARGATSRSREIVRIRAPFSHLESRAPVEAELKVEKTSGNNVCPPERIVGSGAGFCQIN